MNDSGNGDSLFDKNKEVSYTVNGITFTSYNPTNATMSLEGNGIKYSTNGQKLEFEVGANKTVTIYIRSSASDGTRKMIVKLGNETSLEVVKNYSVPSGITNVTSEIGKNYAGTNDGNCIKLTITTNATTLISIEASSTMSSAAHLQKIIIE